MGVEPLELWDHDGRMETVVVGIGDVNGLSVRITGVTQDEPVVGLSGGSSPDAVLREANSAELRVERDDGGDGRVYSIAVASDDGRGGTCTGSVTVSIRPDRSGVPAVDSGARYDSTSAPPAASGAPCVSEPPFPCAVPPVPG